MRDNPRYSITPGGAVTDPRLEDRDLRVLCLLGCHSDKLGWCEAASQSAWAALIKCSRQTFQRSIARLIEAGWVQARATCVSQGGQSYASYAYRVVMDRDDPAMVLSGYEVAAQPPDDPAHRWATLPIGGQPCPPSVGTPCPRIHGQQEVDQAETKNESESRAREASERHDAFEVTRKIATIAGVGDAEAWPPGWKDAAIRVQQFLADGYTIDVLLMGASEAMASRKDPDPPWSVEYFARPFAKVKARRARPLPTIETPTESQKVMTNGKSSDRSFKSALAKLDDRIQELKGGISGGSETPVRLLPDRRRE